MSYSPISRRLNNTSQSMVSNLGCALVSVGELLKSKLRSTQLDRSKENATLDLGVTSSSPMWDTEITKK